MPDDDTGRFIGRSLKAFQENVTRSGSAAGAGYSLIGALVLLGGIGYAVDSWLGTAPGFLAGGLFLGVVVGMYELAKIVWPR